MKKMLAFALCLVMLLSCVPAMAEEQVYTALYSSEVSTLNYLVSGTQWDQTVGANVIDSLVEYNAYSQVIPGLAESWECSEDGLVWTFHLRKGVKWYDYQCEPVAEVTANDFVAAAKYILTPEYASNVESALEGAKIKNAAEYYAGEVTDFAEVGVKAVDDYTLEYTLESPVPYFESCLTYTCFLPAYGPQIEELGAAFGTDNTKMYYCGAFILTEYEPQVKHVYSKNVNNWDADNIYIDKIQRIYNAEAGTVAPEMALRGQVDNAGIDNTILADWQKEHGDILSRARVVPDYSYFYCFNFDPHFDASFEPDNWLIAVNNQNFRQSIMKAFDRVWAMYALEPEDPDSLVQNTITPKTFCAVDGVDFTALDVFDQVENNFFQWDEEGTSVKTALKYKEAAIKELTEAGCKFPVIIPLNYKASDSDWEAESKLMEQQLEEALGTDYIDVQLLAGSSDNFLANNRRNGNYGMMRCNWGADYADPETWTDPFRKGNNYNFMDKMLETDFAQTKETLEKYYELVADAKAEVVNLKERFNKFATAERWLIDNAMVVPYYISGASYQVTKLNIFEGEFAPFGISTLRYKYQKLDEDFVSAEEYEASLKAWQDAVAQ